MQVAKCPARAKKLKNKTWSPEIIFIAGDQVPIAQRSAPKGSGTHCPHQAKLTGLISVNTLNDVINFQLATKKVTSPDAVQSRPRWVWVKPTKKQTIFF